MASPMAQHWASGGVRVVRIHDRGAAGAARDDRRAAWRRIGAALVGSFDELAGNGDLDGVFVCCGKNGDDLPIIAALVPLLDGERERFICHLSTVSTSFVRAAAGFCAPTSVRYVNYPLTGGPAAAAQGTMLILAGGPPRLFERLEPALGAIGAPRYFGASETAGTEVKFIGHMMMFNGLVGICSAVAAFAECFDAGGVGGDAQTACFDFLNAGAGGTRQWELIVRAGVRDGAWSSAFSAQFGAIDAIYAAHLAIERRLSEIVSSALIRAALALSFLVNEGGATLGTHAIVRELVTARGAALDRFVARHAPADLACPAALQCCIDSLPPEVARLVHLHVGVADFAVAARAARG